MEADGKLEKKSIAMIEPKNTYEKPYILVSGNTNLRRLLETGGEFTLEQLMELTGKSQTYLVNRISALQNPRYAGRLGALKIRVVRRGKERSYQIE